MNVNGRTPRVALYTLAVAVLVAGVWWAIAMPDRYVYPAEGPPILDDKFGTRLALGALSVVVAVALGTFAHLIRKDRGIDARTRNAAKRGRATRW